MMKLPLQKAPAFPAAPVIAQTLIVALVMLAALLAPPASGSILLVPLRGQAGGTVLQDALSHGARLEGAGPISGTFVVRAKRDQLASTMAASGVLMLAARPLLCGDEPAGAAQ